MVCLGASACNFFLMGLSQQVIECSRLPLRSFTAGIRWFAKSVVSGKTFWRRSWKSSKTDRITSRPRMMSSSRGTWLKILQPLITRHRKRCLRSSSTLQRCCQLRAYISLRCCHRHTYSRTCIHRRRALRQRTWVPPLYVVSPTEKKPACLQDGVTLGNKSRSFGWCREKYRWWATANTYICGCWDGHAIESASKDALRTVWRVRPFIFILQFG